MTASAIYCLGISHQTAPVALREQVNCDPVALERVLADRPEIGQAIQEWVVLSTCNRFEVYVQMAGRLDNAEELLIDWWYHARPFDRAALQPHIYFHQCQVAAQHLFRIAAGLDSQVLGESQILGQVANALAVASENERTGPYLQALFQAAVRAGKRARTETAISCHPSSISSVAVSQIEAYHGHLVDLAILVVGAGEMAQLAVKGLQKRGVQNIAVANRTVARGRELLPLPEGAVYSLDQLPEVLVNMDAVISATSAPAVVLDYGLVAEAMHTRPDRPLTLVDIAVPRDIDEAIAYIPGVYLINMDELHDNLEVARQARENEVPAVELILQEELENWQAAMHEIEVRPVIRQLRLKAETIRQRELERTLKHLGPVDPETEKHIQHLSRALVNQLLHEPTLKLREPGENGDSVELTTAVQDLFNLSI